MLCGLSCWGTAPVLRVKSTNYYSIIITYRLGDWCSVKCHKWHFRYLYFQLQSKKHKRSCYLHCPRTATLELPEAARANEKQKPKCMGVGQQPLLQRTKYNSWRQIWDLLTTVGYSYSVFLSYVIFCNRMHKTQVSPVFMWQLLTQEKALWLFLKCQLWTFQWLKQSLQKMQLGKVFLTYLLV